MMRGICFLIVFVFALGSLKSQTDFEPDNSLKVEVGLPATLEAATNKSFRDLMTGLLNASVAFQSTPEFSRPVSYSGGLRYSLFNVNEFRNNFDLSGNLHVFGAYGRVGSEQFYGDLGVDYGIKIGYTRNYAMVNKCIDETGRAGYSEAIMVEPNIAFNYRVDPNSAFTFFNLSYSFYTFPFEPRLVCMDDFPGFSESDWSGITTFLSIGFGYTYYF